MRTGQYLYDMRLFLIEGFSANVTMFQISSRDSDAWFALLLEIHFQKLHGAEEVDGVKGRVRSLFFRHLSAERLHKQQGL